ncbi:glycosyltransferase [Flavobacterium sp. FZUC8N2.13]|uniref:Glycosyltransferase n=1 Tax=Flavobacterium zubiriense TaxID=3138075 RepID=A0ABV4T7Q8_9FLAO
MIVIYHSFAKIREVLKEGNQKIDFDSQSSLAKFLHNIAQRFPNEKIVWCHWDCKANLNLEAIISLFHHNQLMLSFNPGVHSFLGRKIGYVEESLCVSVNKKVSYPTWQMSSAVGVIHASVVIALKDQIPLDVDFDYYLNSVAKLAMPLGLFCYSEPRLLSGSMDWISPKANSFTLFKFVKQHYKTRWVFLLGLNLALYESQWMILPYFYALFFKRRKTTAFPFNLRSVQSSKQVVDKATIDVIIPTIGRKQYLYDVLCDLRIQTHLPKKVIIVEQNPILESASELDYLTTESWPFEIKAIFTHQAGACNARNLAIDEVTSEWVFLADDDIRIEKDFNFKILETINRMGAEAVSICCIQKGEKPRFKTIFQWGSFGSGCSFVARKAIEKCSFNRGYEFGYGEDSDFGMQLRNQGIDVLYIPEPQILHLKAPMGGFRTKPVLQWQKETIQPKPSPTVMLYRLLHQTQEQRSAYKTTLFFKFYSKQTIKNPLKYLISYKKQWNQSLYWANQLKKQS